MKGVVNVIEPNKNTPKNTGNKKTYTIDEIAKQLNISMKSAYKLVRSEQFHYVRAGRAIRVSKTSFDEWLNK